MLLMLADYDAVELRFTWDPGDGQGRIREVGPNTSFPFPKPGTFDRWAARLRGRPVPDDQPAALVIAGSTDLVSMPLPSRRFIRDARVYLGGLDQDGNIGAVPFQAHPDECAELCRLGANTTPRDPNGDLVIELRITREGDRVRYRWGPATFLTSRDVGRRFSGGDVVFTADEVSEGGEGPLLPGLADRLARARPGPRPPYKIVLLEHGSGVRYVDILRAVECAPGDPLVTFQPWPDLRGLEQITLPSPALDGAPVLGECLDLGQSGKVFLVNVVSDEEIFVRKVQQSLDSLKAKATEFTRQDECEIRADRGVRWTTCVPVIRLVRAAGLPVCFALKPLDPALKIEAMFRLPAPGPEEAPVEVTLVSSEDGLTPDRKDVAGKPVKVRIPDEANVEETLHALIRLRTAGATGFDFE